MIIKAMVQRARVMLIFLFLASFSKTSGGVGVGVEVGKPNFWRREIIPPPQAWQAAENAAYCLSWRLGVEANNVRWWRTVPGQCLRYVETYMIGGQYERDVGLIVDQITSYAAEITVSDDGLDAWIFDVDDTCISNVFYYRGKRYGCDPYDPSGFKAWAKIGGCPAVPGMLDLFNKLIEFRFKVFLVTGRDEETLGQPTIDNLHNQGFQDYERLIMRSAAYRGLSAVIYKSEIRKQLMKQGYRIWGNVGDQWSDLQGECLGNRTFKLPNPMYFVP